MKPITSPAAVPAAGCFVGNINKTPGNLAPKVALNYGCEFMYNSNPLSKLKPGESCYVSQGTNKYPVNTKFVCKPDGSYDIIIPPVMSPSKSNFGESTTAIMGWFAFSLVMAIFLFVVYAIFSDKIISFMRKRGLSSFGRKLSKFGSRRRR
jgi:hypothetical protein